MESSSEHPPGLWRRIVSFLFPTAADLRLYKKPLLLTLVSALFGALIFHQNALGALAWVALAPYFVALHYLRGKLLVWATLAFGFIWYYLSLFWLHTLIVFHWMIPVGVIVGSLYVGAYFLFFAVPAAWCCRQLSPVLRPWAVAVCWTGVEYLRNFSDMAFPWNLLGHSQAPWNTPFMHLASLGGVPLLSLIMAFVNAGLATLWVERRTAGVVWKIPASIAATLSAACAAIFFTMPKSTLAEAPWQFRVSIVQPGISQIQKWRAMMGQPDDTAVQYQSRWLETENLMLERLATLTREAAAADKPELVVLPESVFMRPGFPLATDLQQQLRALSAETGADLLFGADNLLNPDLYAETQLVDQPLLRLAEARDAAPMLPIPLITRDDGTTAPDHAAIEKLVPTVAAWHISRNATIAARAYNKMQLVPFGERVPFLSSWQWLQEKFELAGIAGAYRPGLQNVLFDIETSTSATDSTGARLEFGTVICFESTFSYLTRDLAEAGANFLCVLTNDSWYDPSYAIADGGFWGTLLRLPGLRQLASAGPDQHLIHSQFRAIETGLPVVRAANTGISAFIDGSGAITSSLEYGTSGYVSDIVRSGAAVRSAGQGTTVFVSLGEWVGKMCLGIWGAILCLLVLGRSQTSGKKFALHK